MKPLAIPDVGYQTWSVGQLDTLKAADVNAAGGSGVDNYFFPFELPIDPSISSYCPNMNNPHADPFNEIGRNGSPIVVGPAGYPTGTCGSDPQCWYRANICNQNCSEVNLTTTYDVVQGDMDGPTAFGINVLIAQDPEVWFNSSDGQLYRGSTQIAYDETPRTIKVALYDPALYTHPSQTTIDFTGIALFFLEYGPFDQTGWQQGFHHPWPTLPPGFKLYDTQDQAPIVGRFLAFAPGSSGGANTSPFALYLRLVK